MAIDPGFALSAAVTCPSAAVCVALDDAGAEIAFDPQTVTASDANPYTIEAA